MDMEVSYKEKYLADLEEKLQEITDEKKAIRNYCFG